MSNSKFLVFGRKKQMVAWAVGHLSLAQPRRWAHSGLAMAPGCGTASEEVPFILNHQKLDIGYNSCLAHGNGVS